MFPRERRNVSAREIVQRSATFACQADLWQREKKPGLDPQRREQEFLSWHGIGRKTGFREKDWASLLWPQSTVNGITPVSGSCSPSTFI